MTEKFKPSIIINTYDKDEVVKFEKVMVYEGSDIDSIFDIDDDFNNKYIKKLDIKSGNKIHFLSNCEVPRFKLKEFMAEKNITQVKFKENADILFISLKSITQRVVKSYPYCIRVDQTIKWLDETYPIGDIRVEDLREVLSTLDDDQNIYTRNIGVSNTIDVDVDCCNIIKLEIDQYKYLKFIENNTDKIYKQDEILKLLNTEIVMDEEMYLGIQRLLESEDKENTKLAMESMANCNFKESIVYVLLTISKYRKQLLNSPSINHINFKAMLQFYNIKLDYRSNSFGIDDVITIIQTMKLFTQSNIDKLLKYAKEFVEISTDSDYFNAEAVKLTLADDVKDEIIDDEGELLNINEDDRN